MENSGWGPTAPLSLGVHHRVSAWQVRWGGSPEHSASGTRQGQAGRGAVEPLPPLGPHHPRPTSRSTCEFPLWPGSRKERPLLKQVSAP